MRSIEIRNIGPVISVKIDLNRFNVFIGRQSSGKSTIAKMVSNCTWMEKEIATHPFNPIRNYESSYIEELVGFHNMEGYITKDSYLRYDSDYLTIVLERQKCVITKKAAMDDYKRKKVLYIPSERNMVVYTDSIGGANNLRSFAADWQSARDIFDEGNKQKILDLGVRYYKTGENGKTINHVASLSKERPYDINLKSGSSGLQSVIPITTTIDFFTGHFYDPNIQDKLMKSNDMYDVRHLVEYFVKARHIKNAEEGKEEIVRMMDDVMGLVNTVSTSFVIEEPENNLFPETQYSLVNFIVNCMNRNNRHHEATITTHSPYVLSTLNILLLAGKLVKHEEFKPMVGKIASETFIDASELSVWNVSNGKVMLIMDKTTQMISENYLDTVSDVLAGKFNELYKLYVKSLRKG